MLPEIQQQSQRHGGIDKASDERGVQRAEQRQQEVGKEQRRDQGAQVIEREHI